MLAVMTELGMGSSGWGALGWAWAEQWVGLTVLGLRRETDRHFEQW